jgi:hypothetical protein
MRCVLRLAAKIGGTRYPAGATVVVSPDLYAQLRDARAVSHRLSDDGDLVEVARERRPSVPTVVRIPRTAAEKQAALDEAQARVARAAGVTPAPAAPPDVGG